VEALPECGGHEVHAGEVKRLGVPIWTRHAVGRASGRTCVGRVTIARVDARFQPVAGTERTFEADTLLIAVGMCGQGLMLGPGVGQEVASLVVHGVSLLPDEAHASRGSGATSGARSARYCGRGRVGRCVACAPVTAVLSGDDEPGRHRARRPAAVAHGCGGVLRVGRTRVTLDVMVAAFDDGATAEEIAHQYPSLALGDVYAVLGYAIHHRDEVDEYLRRRANLATVAPDENQRRFDPEGVRARLLARRLSP
jgi:uncharacterized protein (DUF433 family)